MDTLVTSIVRGADQVTAFALRCVGRALDKFEYGIYCLCGLLESGLRAAVWKIRQVMKR